MRRAYVMVVLLAGLAGCPKPIPAVPTQAVATKAIVVCWDDVSERDDDTGFLKAFKARLISAGYDLTSSVCDIVFAYAFEWGKDQGDKYYKEATLNVRTGSGTVDKINLTFEYPSDVPASDTDRLAILLVNALNKSEKVAALAKKNHPDEPLRQHRNDEPSCRFGDPGCPPPGSKNLIQAPR